jgi:branched-chain amino acid transport system permease protein
MSAAIEIAVNGVLLGALYALFGLGLSLAFGVMKTINLAHGDLIVLAAFLALAGTGLAGVNPFLCLLFVVPAMAAIGYLLQRTILNQLLGQGLLAPLLVTFGLSIIVQNALQEAFSADTRSLQAGAIGHAVLAVGPVSLGAFPLLIGTVSLAVYALTHLALGRTRAGRVLRAVADDPATARLMGVDDRRAYALAMAAVLALVAVAGVFYGMRTPFSPSAGPERLLFAFEAVVMGGLGSIWGTFAGGVTLGLAQVLGQQLHTGLGQLAGHLAFFAVLLLRPQGLFPRTRT